MGLENFDMDDFVNYIVNNSSLDEADVLTCLYLQTEYLTQHNVKE